MNTYKKFVRPLLFRLNAETAHNFAKLVLQHPRVSAIFAADGLTVDDPRLQVNLGRLNLPNPVGIGAGFDKDCDMVDSLQQLGFGYVVVGSIMYRARPGNPRPRMIRDVKREGLFSCMGLPSRGLDYAVMRLKQRRRKNVPLVINFNAEDFGEYLKCTEALESLGDAIEVSLFCPNRAADEGEFLEPHRAQTLLGEVAKLTRKPVFVKVPGYIAEEERRKRLDLIDAITDSGVDAITVTPKTLVQEKALSMGQGTLTGKPAFNQMLTIVGDIFEATQGRCGIKAAGGIFSAEDAFRAIAAGATAVEMVTAFGFEGWSIAGNINKGLLDLLDDAGLEQISALRGSQQIPLGKKRKNLYNAHAPGKQTTR